MKLSPNSFEFQLFLTLTVIILVVKLVFIAYLGLKVNAKRKETGGLSLDFLTGIFLLFICLFVSRLFYLFFDFVFTQFDTSTAHLEPAITFWKLAALTANIGYIISLFVIDKKVLNFRFKGFFAYILAIAAVIQFFWPVNSPEGFQIVSTINLFAFILAVLIPIIFLYIGIKTPALRKTSFTIAFGVIIFAIGSLLTIEAISLPLRNAYGVGAVIGIYFLHFLLKAIGLGMFSYGVTKFSA